MKKIGILSINGTLNYGAVLQEYALYNFLKENGFDVQIINYVNKAIFSKEHPSLKNAKSIKKLLTFFLLRNKIKSKDLKFSEFEKKMIFSNKITNINDEELKDFDYIIVGSDQVWNTKITANDMNFFLKGITDSDKKKTYAASFGYIDLPPTYEKIITNELSSFSSLLIREKEPCDYIREKYGLQCDNVLDPTLILDKKEWHSLVGPNPICSDEYILVYFPRNKKRCFDQIKEIEKRDSKKYKVIYINISPRKQIGVKNIYDAAPVEFLNLINFAKYVIVGSFHGLAFSIIFNKQFYYDDFDPNIELQGRLTSLMNILGIKGRELSRVDSSNIDYNNVNISLQKHVDKSRRLLLESINKGI